MKVESLKLKVLGILSIVVVAFMFTFSFASAEGNRVVCDLQASSKSVVKASLKFLDAKITDNIHITVYKKYSDNAIVIYYTAGKDISIFDSVNINITDLGLKLGNDVLPNIVLKDENSNNTNNFKDLSDQKYYYFQVLNLVNRGIINGYPDMTFRPDQNISREEFCQVFAKSSNLISNNIDLNIFKDIEKDRWSKSAINALAVKGILKGKEQGMFAPKDSITLGEMAAIVNRMYKFVSISNDTDLKHLKVSHWANEYVTILLNAGIINKEDDFYKNYDLNKKLTRAESTYILGKVLNVYKTENK